MLNRKEIIAIVIIAVILAFSISLMQSMQLFLYTLLSIFIIIVINMIAKKAASFYFDSEVEIKLWEAKRFGYRKHWYLKKPFPIGAFLPLLTTALSFGYVVWMGSLIFDVKAKVYRAAKRHELYAFSEMTEWHIGLIAAAGILANLIFAGIGYLIGFPTFARLNIYYAFFNMIPFSNLDGNKIFFGSIVLWSFLAAIVLIALAYAFLLV